MKIKIVGILVSMLLVVTAISSFGITIDSKVEKTYASDNMGLISVNVYYPKYLPFWWLIGADQQQTSNCHYGDEIFPPLVGAQEFKPTKETLTAVALSFFKTEPPSGIEITVSIRDALKGSDLATETVNGDDVIKRSRWETWVLFDFPDITVTPETTYYIVCSINGGGEDANQSYLWYFDIENKYDRGMAWFSGDSGETWFDLEDIPEFPQMDFCFITYWQKPKSTAMNTLNLKIFDCFPILRTLLNLLI